MVNVLLGRGGGGGGVCVCVCVCMARPTKSVSQIRVPTPGKGEGRGGEGKLWEHVNYPNIWTFKDLEFYFTHSIHVKQCTSWFARL